MSSTTTPAAPFTRAAGPAHTRNYIGHLFTFLADSADTGGAFSLIDATIRRGLEPPPHTHTREDETFYIVSGRITFRVGDEVVAAEAGQCVHMPRGLQHSFAVETDGARALILMTPGGLEDAFKEMSEPTDVTEGLPPAPQGPPPVERMLAVFGAHGVEFAPPPAAA